MKWLRSTVVSTPPSIGASKLGHPVPLSNFVSDANNGVPQAAQRYIPARFSLFKGLVPRISVPWHRITSYCAGVSSARHCSSVFSGAPARASGFFVSISIKKRGDFVPAAPPYALARGGPNAPLRSRGSLARLVREDPSKSTFIAKYSEAVQR